MSPTRHSTTPLNLEARLQGFFQLFQPTIGLAEKLIAARSNPQELILLLCARLDALASCIKAEDQPNRRAFISLLTKYSGYSDLMQCVSAGDLYYELGYHRWLSEGLVPKPGRLYKFSRLNDPIIHLLDRSDIPLTPGEVDRLLSRAMRALKDRFRCGPGQALKKPMMGKPRSIMQALESEFQHPRDSDISPHLKVAFQPLLESKTAAAILYENFRNNAIHGARVQIDEAAFFKLRKPFWQPLYSDYYPPFLFLKFPARFLIELLQNSLRTLQRKMLATRKLPPDVHFHVFPFDEGDYLQFLDVELLPKGANLRFQTR
jgi:hypothetical protein